EDAAGHLAFSVDLSSDGRGARGRVAADLQGVRYRNLQGVTGKLAVAIDGEAVKADVDAALGDAGKLRLATDDVRRPVRALAAASWFGATVNLAIDGSVDLARFADALPEVVPTGTKLGGVIALRGTAARDRKDAPPAVEAHAETRCLVYAA